MIYQGNYEIKQVYWKGGVPTWFYRVYRVFPVIYRIKLGNPVIVLDNGEWNDSYAADISYNDSIDVAKINVRSGSQEVFIFNVSAVTDSGELIDGVNWGVDTVWNYPDLTVCDWLWAEKVYTKVHGKNNNYWTIHISAGTNTNAEVRSGDTNIRIFLEGTQGWDGVSDAGKIYGKVRLIQAGAPTLITFNPTGATFNSGGTNNSRFTYVVNLENPPLPSVRANGEWITIISSGVSSATYSVAPRYANAEGEEDSPWEERTGSIVVSYGAKGQKLFTIRQSAATATLSASTSYISIPNKNSASGTFTVSTNMADDYWTMSSSQSWLTLTRTGKTITWNATQNDSQTFSQRTATITISSELFTVSPVTVTVTQQFGCWIVANVDSYGQGQGDLTIDSGVTSFYVDVFSVFNGNPNQPYYNGTGDGDFNIAYSSSSQTINNNDKIYRFYFTCPANTIATARTNTMYFSTSYYQSGYNYDDSHDLSITQKATKPATPFVRVGTSQQSSWQATIDSTGGSGTFNVSANTAWTVSVDEDGEDWISASKGSGNPNASPYGGRIAWSAISNPTVRQRTGRVYAHASSTVRDYGEIIQYGSPAYLNLSPTSVTSIPRTGATGTIAVSTNYDSWVVDSKPSWVNVTATTTGVNWSVGVNDSNTHNIRSGELRIAGYIDGEGEGITSAVTFSQVYGSYLEITSPSTASTYMISSAGLATLEVTVASSYNGAARQPYFNLGEDDFGNDLEMTSSANPEGSRYVFYFSFAANPGEYERDATLVFTNDYDVVELNVRQNPKVIVPTISIESSILSIPATGKTGTTSVTANTTSWTAESNKSWLSVTAQTGSSNVKYSAGTNTDSGERTATITVRNGSASDSRTVSQAAPPQPYVFHLMDIGNSTGTSLTYNISSAASTTNVMLVSYSGSTAILTIDSALTSGQYYNVTGVTANTGTGNIIPNMVFDLRFAANPNTSARSSIITFTQRPSYKTVTATVTQAPKYETPSEIPVGLSQVLSSCTLNGVKWTLGFIEPYTTNGSQGAIVAISEDSFSQSRSVMAFVEYGYGGGTSAVNRTTSYQQGVGGSIYPNQGYLTIPANSTFTYPTKNGGIQFNGAVLAKANYMTPVGGFTPFNVSY